MENIELNNLLNRSDEANKLKTILKDFELNKNNLLTKRGIYIYGDPGSGKTTLADLLPRFYDCTSGEISIDGLDVKNIKLTDLRNLMGIVTQESILFNDTIFNNRYFRVPVYNYKIFYFFYYCPRGKHCL